MKTVKIPDCMNPFEVIVNNHRYRYPGGTTQEVPDEVAEVIEVHMKNHADMTAPPYVPGGGGATCKLKLTASNNEENGYTLSGTLYVTGYENIALENAIGTTSYEIPCGSIIALSSYNAWPSGSKMTELMNGNDFGVWIYRVEANPGETASLSLYAYC
jgi:hypothetical protein